MKSYIVLGCTADADTWCKNCCPDEVNCDQDHGAIFADSEWDYPVHCAGCGELLPVNLTSDGYAYVREALARFGDPKILEQWRTEYGIEAQIA